MRTIETLQEGDIIKQKGKESFMKCLGVCGQVYFFSQWGTSLNDGRLSIMQNSHCLQELPAWDLEIIQ